MFLTQLVKPNQNHKQPLELPAKFPTLRDHSQWLFYKESIEDILSQPPYNCWTYVSGHITEHMAGAFDVLVMMRARKLLMASLSQEYQDYLQGLPKTLENSYPKPGYTTAVVIDDSEVFVDDDPFPERVILPRFLWIALQHYVVDRAEINKKEFLEKLTKTKKSAQHSVSALTNRVTKLSKMIGGKTGTAKEKKLLWLKKLL